MSRLDVEGLKARADLGAIVERYLGAPVKQNGRWWWWRCPFHQEKTPSFGVTPDDGRFKCYGCGVFGDVLEFVRRMERLGDDPAGFVETCKRVAALVGAGAVAERPVREAQHEMERQRPPEMAWQTAARRVVEEAERRLWDVVGEGARAREYLLEKRGLTEETVRAWRLGWWPNSTWEKPEAWGLERQREVWLPQGLVIPGEVSGALWYVKFRPARAAGFKGKYYGIPGGRTALLGADRWAPGLDLLLCEGEMDCLTAWQELRDVVNVGTLGGAAKGRRGEGVDFGRWTGALVRFECIYAAYDADAAGTAAGEALEAFSARVTRVQTPYGGDLNAFHVLGGDLGAWWRSLSAPVMVEPEAEGPEPLDDPVVRYPVTLIFEDARNLPVIARRWQRRGDGRVEVTFSSPGELAVFVEAAKAVGYGRR